MPSFGKTQLKLLEKLCNSVAISGDEGEVRKIVLEEIKSYADDIKIDALGNVLATRHGRGRNRVRVMIDAHMDEVGFYIVAEDGDGIYRFETVGGINVKYLVGKQVLVGKSRTPGVIGAKPVHLMDADEAYQRVPLESMRIDLGLGGKAQVGDRAGFATKFKRVGPSILAKSIDDRIGVATVIELIKHSPPNIDLCAAFSVQEEIGLRGAKVAAQYFSPDMAIAIDATPAHDVPRYDGSENTSYNTKLGAGPAIYIADRSTLHDPRLVQFLCDIGNSLKIPWQLRQPGGGRNDSSAIQNVLVGIPTVSVSVPHRYTHSPLSIARVNDWKNTLHLLHTALKKIRPGLISNRK